MKMGGLRKKLPWTHATFLIYCIAIAGIPPFAGFFSKDAILASAFAFDYAHPRWPHFIGPMVGTIGLVAALCTSFYMFRAYFLVFAKANEGEPRAIMLITSDGQLHELDLQGFFARVAPDGKRIAVIDGRYPSSQITIQRFASLAR